MKSLWVSLLLIYASVCFSSSEILQKDPLLIPANTDEDDSGILREAQNRDPLAEFAYGRVQYQKKNFKEAALWFLKAANQGHENAQYSLGKLFAEGVGVTKNNVKAYFFFSLSADKEFEPAVKAKAELGKKMSQEQMSDAMSLYARYKQNR